MRYAHRHRVLEVVLVGVALLWALPIVGLINVSFKDRRNFSGAFEIAGDYTLANFGVAWADGQLGTALLWSCVITVASVLLILAAGSLAAYPLARVGRTWSRVAFYAFLAGLVIPGQLGLLPLYQDMRGLGLIGNPAGLILIFAAGGMPFTIFVLTTFLRELSPEYEEAAVVDGGSSLRVFWHVVIPMLKPALGTVAVLNGLAVWNNFFVALLYLSGTGFETAPIHINRFVGTLTSNWPAIFAALTIASIPILAVYVRMQRNVIEGFAGGLKG